MEMLLMFETLINASGSDFENMTGVHKIIDRIFFEVTRYWFFGLMIIYIFGFICPFLWGEFELIDKLIARTICSFTMGFFTLIELADLKNGIYEYYNEVWNWFDTVQIIMWFYFYALEFNDSAMKQS